MMFYFTKIIYYLTWELSFIYVRLTLRKRYDNFLLKISSISSESPTHSIIRDLDESESKTNK